MILTALRTPLLMALLTTSLTMPASAMAQAIPCDQGVVRLPDRVGTVQICSALATQVPALSKQLGEAVKLLGNQQQQIRELTRLVRSLNGSSAGLDAARQGQLLRSLSAELARAEQRGPEATRRAVEDLGEQFEGLRDQLVQALSQPTSAAATNEALKGRLGDSIAQLELRSATRQIDEIGERLKQVQTDLGTVKTGVAQANDKLDRLATAVDPTNPADRCTDLDCAILGNASVHAVQRLVSNGARVVGIPNVSGMLVMAVLPYPAAKRETLLGLLQQAGLNPQVRFYPMTEDVRLIGQHAIPLADAVMQRLGEARSTPGTTSGGSATVNWNKLASCLYTGNDGVTVTELAALLGDAELMTQARRLGFAPPRSALTCRSLRLRGGTVTILIDDTGRARLQDG